jgi:hypothetical protein
MRATADHVKAQIRTGHVDTLVAEDVSTGEKVGYYAGSADALCAGVDELEASMLVPYRVKAFQAAQAAKRGVKSAPNAPFVWILSGLSGSKPASGGIAPIQPTNAPAPSAVPLELARDAAKHEAHNTYLQQRIDELARRCETLEAALEDAEDEIEEADEVMQAAPPPPPLKWYERDEFGAALKPLIEPLGKALAAKIMGPTAPAQPMQAAPPTGAAPSAEQARILAAVENWRKADPEQAAQYISMLVDNFAAPPDQPPTNGQA